MSLMQVISPFPFPLSPFPFPLSPSLVSRAPWTPLGQAQWECRNGVQECNVPGKCTLMPQPFSRCAAPSLTELPVAISQQCATEKQSWSASIAKRTANRGVRSPRSQSKAMLPQCPSCTGRLVSPPRPQPHRLWSPKRHSQVQDLSTLNPKPQPLSPKPRPALASLQPGSSSWTSIFSSPLLPSISLLAASRSLLCPNLISALPHFIPIPGCSLS